MIDYADKDRDGGISFDEFVATVTRQYPKVWFVFKDNQHNLVLSSLMHIRNNHSPRRTSHSYLFTQYHLQALTSFRLIFGKLRLVRWALAVSFLLILDLFVWKIAIGFLLVDPIRHEGETSSQWVFFILPIFIRALPKIIHIHYIHRVHKHVLFLMLPWFDRLAEFLMAAFEP